MREFASSHSRAAGLPTPAKLVYTAFALLTLAGVVGSAALYHEMLGWADLDTVTQYYWEEELIAEPMPVNVKPTSASAGPELDIAPEGDPPGDDDGPRLELELDENPEPTLVPSAGAPATAPAGRIVVAQSYRKMLEVSHFHLFSMPVLLLIVGHLFMLVGWGPRAKMIWIGAGTVATALHVLAPWAVHWWGNPAAWLYPTSGILLLGSYSVMLIVPVWDMWRPRASGDGSRGIPAF